MNILLCWSEQGAKKIGNYLLEAYGEDAFALLVDEGSSYIILANIFSMS
jgi:hypothetical protein